jgi:peptidoglycan/xylan/chitin deacetylase (PgdA/CDA1 family)
MSLVKEIYYTACAALPMPLLKKLMPATTLLPYHHTVSDAVLPHISHLYSYKNIAQFTADLDYLLKHFRPVSPGDLLDSVTKDKTLPADSFLLTFDDGFKEVYHVIAPILEAKGVPAIFFINPAFIDNKALFYRSKTSLLIHELLKRQEADSVIALYGNALNLKDPTTDKIIHTFKAAKNFTDDTLDHVAGQIGYSFDDYLQREKPFLTSEQVSSLHDRGFTIGAHSWDHPYYPALDHAAQMEQTISSCAYAQTHFNEARKYFSFPYSDAALPQILFDALKKTDIDLLFGIQNQKEELGNKMLHRFNAERPGVPMNKLLKGMMALMAYQRSRDRHKVIRN